MKMLCPVRDDVEKKCPLIQINILTMSHY